MSGAPTVVEHLHLLPHLRRLPRPTRLRGVPNLVYNPACPDHP